jgi:hypothetical protein
MRVAVSTTISVSADRIFWTSQDYERRLDWDPYLSEARLLGGAREPAIGVTSYCRNKAGATLESRYIAFSPPTHTAVVMTRGPWLLKRFAGTWRFRSIGLSLTEVRFIYSFDVRPYVLSWLLGPIVAHFYKRDMALRLDALKRWTELN